MVVNTLTLFIYIPLVVALLNIILPSTLRKLLNFLSIGYLLYLSYTLLEGTELSVTLFGQVVIAADKLAVFTLTFIQILSFIILIFALKGVAKNIDKHFFILYPLTVAFSNGAVLSTSMLALLIFWGLSGITLYLFGHLGQTRETGATAKKTLIIVGGSDVFLILGLIIVSSLAPETGGQLWNTGIPLSSSLAYLAFFCILIAAFAKAGGFPLHTWVPEFAKDAPIESAAFLPASLDKLLGIYLLARMVIQLFVLNTVMHLIIMTLGALTVITAVMMAMIQHNGRKLLGYHAVSQVGYMILGVGSGNVLAFIGGLFHMINHTIYKSNLFLSLGAVEKKTGTSELDELGGLARNMPITFITAAIGAFAISGIPPFNGFFSKWMIYQGVLDQAKSAAAGFQIWYLICLILAVFGSALTLASFMKFLHAIFLGRRPKTLAEVREAPFNQWFATGMLALLCILFGLFAIKGPLNFFLNPIVSQFGWTTPQMLGDYQPGFILIMILIPFLLGLFLYRMIRNVRFDEIYLGGMTAEEKFRILGTEFYKEIKNMVPLKAIYQGAEKKYFDVYALGSRFSGWCASLFQGLHRGQLQIYSLWIILGTIILIWIVK